MERYTGRPVAGEKIAIVRFLGGIGSEMGDFPGAWICRMLFGMNSEAGDGRRDALVDGTAVVVENSEGEYFEEEIRWRGIDLVEAAVELIILVVD